MTKNRKFDIYERAFEFAVRVANLLSVLPKNQAILEYSKQLIRSSGSIGANIEEADGALTKKDFINKLGIARREARESKHWLRLIEKITPFLSPDKRKGLDWQINEAEELMLILSSIINKTKRR